VRHRGAIGRAAGAPRRRPPPTCAHRVQSPGCPGSWNIGNRSSRPSSAWESDALLAGGEDADHEHQPVIVWAENKAVIGGVIVHAAHHTPQAARGSSRTRRPSPLITPAS
jgi:hypothetical protein